MKRNYPYLKDITFLNKIYSLHHKTIYAKVTVLDWMEKPLQEVQGKIVSGNLSINGDSAVRRTANLTIQIRSIDDLYNQPDSLFTLNKKVFLELGIKNNIGHLSQENYPDYPTIWFPFGIFVIQNHSVTHSLSDMSISLTLGDKMCLLNGEAGGTIPASTNFESYDTLGADGELHSEYIKINELIPEIVNHFGNEDLNNIIVNDVPDKITQVLKWRGQGSLFLWLSKVDPKEAFYTTKDVTTTRKSDLPGADNWNIRKITYNYDAGYTYVDFVYPGELTANAGDSVCTVLDKIKETLGNYEYYYDVFGTFIFQEIKNYVNTSEWKNVFLNYREHNGIPYSTYEPGQGMTPLDLDHEFLPYSYNTRLNTAVYSFDDTSLITSYSNTPQFNMIKNDFIVWGVRKDINGEDKPCRYHLAIDKKPKVHNDVIDNICFDTNVHDGIRRAFIIKATFDSLESLQAHHGIVGEYYKVAGDGANSGIYTYVSDINNYNTLLDQLLSSGKDTQNEDTAANKTIADNTEQIVGGYIKPPLATYYYGINPPEEGEEDHRFFIYRAGSTTDWRNILYFNCLRADAEGHDAGYYWAEMKNEWPKIYDVEHNRWYQEALDFPASLDWWLDFIDNDAMMNKFAIDAIGRRSYATTDTKCNCVFEPDIPDIIMINTLGGDETSIDTRSQKTQQELKELGLIPCQVSDSIYQALTTGGTFNSCYQHMRQLLANYTDYNENISVSCIPIYHLEPNTRVFFNDPISGVYGDYIINTINFDLGNSGIMNITAKKVIEKI